MLKNSSANFIKILEKRFQNFFITSAKLIIFAVTPISVHNFLRFSIEFPWIFHVTLLPNINDNLTSVLLTGPAFCKIQFWYIVPMEGPVLHSIAFIDASRCDAKKRGWNSVDCELRFENFIPEGTFGRTYRWSSDH